MSLSPSISDLREVINRLRSKATTWKKVIWPASGGSYGCKCCGHTADGFWVDAKAFRQERVGGGELEFSVTDGGPGGTTVFRFVALARAYRTLEGTAYINRMQYTPNELNEQVFQVALEEIEAYIEQAKKDLDARNKAIADAANEAAQRRFFD
jgi:hypothetical protein